MPPLKKKQSHLEVFPAMQFWLLVVLGCFWGSEDSNEKQESNMEQQIFSVLLRDLLCSSNLIMFPRIMNIPGEKIYHLATF